MKWRTALFHEPGEDVERKAQMHAAMEKAFEGLTPEQASMQWHARCMDAGREMGASVSFTTEDGLPCVIFNFTPHPITALSDYPN